MEVKQVNMIIILLIMFFRDYKVLGSEINQILGGMSRDVALKYFINIERSQCVGVITEKNDDFMDYLFPIYFPTYHIKISSEVLHSPRLGNKQGPNFDDLKIL